MSTTLDGLLWIRAIRGHAADTFHLDAGSSPLYFPDGTLDIWVRKTPCGQVYSDTSYKGYVVRHMPASYIQCKNCQRTMPPPAVEFGERLRVLVEIDRLEEAGCGSKKADRWRAWVEEYGIDD